jgi:hypothetical protein
MYSNSAALVLRSRRNLTRTRGISLGRKIRRRNPQKKGFGTSSKARQDKSKAR